MKKERSKLEFSETDLIEVTPTPDLNLPDIVAEKCMCPKDGSPYMVFYCYSKKRYVGGCLACGSVDIVKHGVVPNPRIVHDVMVGINRVDLIVSVPRYRCKDCGAGFRTPFESIIENRNITGRFYEQLCRDSFTRPFSEMALTTGYTETTIRNIFDEYAAELEAMRGPIIAPKILGIDEKHIVNAARGVFVNIETGRLLEMTEDNKKATIQSTIESMVDYDKNIKIVTTDMANGYRNCVYECLPDAKLIVDKYHVYQDLYRKVTSSKTAIMTVIAKRIDEETDPDKQAHLRSVRNLVVHNAYLFKFGKKKLLEKPRRMVVMADVCKTFPELNHLRLIKQGFERIYEESTSREEALSLYNAWLPLIPPKGVKKVEKWEAEYNVNAELFDTLRSFRTTTKNWNKEIFNYFDPGCQVTNAAAEGANSMIQRINAQGTGYGFTRLRAKALYSSNAGHRQTYAIKPTKVPVYRSTKSTQPSMSHSFVNISLNTPARIIARYEVGAELIQEPLVTDDSLSVLSYIDGDSDYYDFEANDV